MPSSGWHRKINGPNDTARAREYNSRAYRDAKKRAQREVDASRAHCWRCGTPLRPGGPWHLGHDDHDRTIIRGPECVPCNLRAAASKGARTVNARRHRGRLTGSSDLTPRRSRSW